MSAPARISSAIEAAPVGGAPPEIGRVEVVRADLRDPDLCAFITDHPDASLFHQPAWTDAVARVYGYEPVTFAARRGGQIVGALSMIDVRGRLFGRSLVSTAFSVGGGVLSSDAAAREALCAQAVAEGRARNVRYVELRSAVAADGWTSKEGAYASYARPLAEDDDAELKAVPRKRRAEIRKGLKMAEAGRLIARHDASVDAFYELYAISLRNLGTPVFPKRFVQAFADAFDDKVIFSIVEADGEPAFSLCSFIYRDRIMPYYAGVTPKAREVKAADFGYFSIMREARQRGLAQFDFGRSKVGSPHADYKRSWGFDAEPITYRYALVEAKETPNLNPSNPKFRLLTNAWRRLPLPLANALGPVIARELA
ncbi:MAG: FemAB family XrtA/PEP-CTERM system-associated protein [Pseudomonadota bacterium]